MSQNPNNNLTKIVLKTDVDVKTVRKYIKVKKLPDELKKEHEWRTRVDPLKNDWYEIQEILNINSGLEAKTIFDYFKTSRDRVYNKGQLRPLQRKVKYCRVFMKWLRPPRGQQFQPKKQALFCE